MSPVNDKVNTSEMVDSLNDVIHFYAFALDANSIRLKDIARLIVREAATLDMI